MSDQISIENTKDASPTAYTPVSKSNTSTRRGPRLSCSSDVYRQLLDICNSDREHFVVFDLDARHRIIERRIVHIGTLTGVEVHPREVFRQALLNSAAAIIIAHNHPSGDVSPSRQDLEITSRLREVGEILGIALLDHVIVAGDGFLSLAERGWV